MKTQSNGNLWDKPLIFDFEILKTNTFGEKLEVVKSESFRHAGQANAQHEV